MIALSAILAAAVLPMSAESVLKRFVTVKGDQLVDGGEPYRFISFNIPNLHLVEDNTVFDLDNAWRWPNRFEITDALESVRQQGGTVVRTYVLSVVRTNDAPGVPRHILGPGKFNEEGFRALDMALEVANQTGVRLIVPFVDNWSWWGGITEYAGFRGKPKDAFWTDRRVISDFKDTIAFMINRTNTLTGVPYRNDKAILCWETGNELQSPAEWTREIAAYIKTLDRNHPVMDGYHTTELREESLTMPEVDIVTTHHYPGGNKTFPELVRANWHRAKGKKPYIVGEFGFVATAQILETMDAVIQTGASGALAWSLRPHNRDGGFYWHSEPAGGNKYKAFHWPGSQAGADYDEIGFMASMQQKAFEIRGLSVPAPQVPASPVLLPTTDAAAISWQGSVGAASYVVERSDGNAGPWITVAENVDETAVQYRPLFADSNVGSGRWFYRVLARNTAGLSRPSNVVGPIQVEHATLVDEMTGFSMLHERHGTLEIRTHDCRKAKEDAHRLAGGTGSSIVYQRPSAIRACRLYAFFAGNVTDFRFMVSADGKDYQPIASTKQVYVQRDGDYGYWKPALFECKPAAGSAKFLKIEFGGEAQIGRIEIESQ